MESMEALEHQAEKAILETKEIWGHMELLVIQEFKGTLVQRVLLDPKVPKVQMVAQGNQEREEKKETKDLLETEENLELLVETEQRIQGTNGKIRFTRTSRKGWR